MYSVTGIAVVGGGALKGKGRATNWRRPNLFCSKPAEGDLTFFSKEKITPGRFYQSRNFYLLTNMRSLRGRGVLPYT